MEASGYNSGYNHVYIVTHSDLDGVGAAAAALRSLGRVEEGSTILFAEPYNLEATLWRLEPHVSPGDLVVISDLGPTRSSLRKIAETLSELAKRDVRVEWYDHHVWDPAELSLMEEAGARMVVDRSTCATGVVARYLNEERYEKDHYLGELERAVCAADLWRWDHYLAPKLFRVVGERDGGEEWKRRLAYKLASGVLWDEEMDKRLESYVNSELEGYNRALRNAYVSEKGGYRIAATYKDFPGPPSSSMIGALLLSRFEADVAVIIRSDGGISLRSRKVDVQLIARALGGGGHPRAAGAKVKIPLLVKLASILHPRLTAIYAHHLVSSKAAEIGRSNAGL